MLGSLNLGSVRGFLTSFYHREGAGRKPFKSLSMLKAQLLKQLWRVPSDRRLSLLLKRNKRVARACGFKQRTPSHGLFTQFRSRLGGDGYEKVFSLLLEQLLKRGAVNGEVVAVDGTAIKAYSQRSLDNKTGKSDPEARVGRARRGFTLGYKVHMACCASSELPLAFTVAPCNMNEKLFIKPLLENADGVSKHVIAINLDIRGFSSFCKQSQDWDVANYVKIIYSKIIDEYFGIASYFKATGDGLIIIIHCESGDVTEKVNYVVDSCLKLVENFPTLCSDQRIINFDTPSKIGIGIARGSICCITNLKEGKILDYSGRILNLVSRLMDMARPAGIVIDESLGHDLLKDEYKKFFTNSKVYVRDICEKEPITIYYSKKETSIPKEYRSPQIRLKWNTKLEYNIYSEIKTTKGINMMTYLTPVPYDDNEVYLKIAFKEKDTGLELNKHVSSKDKEFEILHKGTNHIARMNRQQLLDGLAENNIAEDEKILFEYSYLIEET